MDGNGIHHNGAFGFGMLPGQGWGGDGLPPGSNPAVIAQQQMHGSPGGYHPQNIGMQHQPIGGPGGMDPTSHPHSPPVGVHNVNVTSNLMDPLEAVLGVFPCVRLRGLPFEASLEDVLVFFQGLVVLDVVVLGSGRSNGKGSGEAFVIFANPIDFQMALQRDRQNMGHRYVEVFQGKRSEYYHAIISQHQQQSGNSGNQKSNEGNHGAEKSTDRSTGGGGPWPDKGGPTPAQAMAMQKGNGDADVNAIQSGEGKNKHKGSGGSSGGSAKSGGRSNHGGSENVGGGKEHTGYLRMRGLPFSATKKDIIEFFKAYKPIEDSVVFSYRSDGRATGEGYVNFPSPEDSKAAMAMHRKTMGSRYIELFISSKEEHRRMVSRSHGR